MKSILDRFLDRLKSKTILDRKPNLKLCSNHMKDTHVSKGRVWNRGQAFMDQYGWYTETQIAKRARRGKRRKNGN